jgi:outer membrane protein assembly factor BamE
MDEHAIMAKFLKRGKKMRIKAQIIFFVSVLASALLLSQCASYDFSRRVVQQGNLITAQKLQRLRIGMSKNEVATIMGTSLISQMFNENRWDYAYTWRKGMGRLEKRTLVLYFKHGRLHRMVKNLQDKNHNDL